MYPVNERKIGDNSCPYCNHTKLKSGVNDLTITNPQLASEFSPRNDKKANEVGEWQVYEVYWICSKCGTEYYAKIRDRSVGDASCPACAGKKAQAGLNSLLDVYPEIQDEWAENENTLLGIFPDEILPTSTARVWWECKDCGRKYLLSVNMWVEKHIRGMTSCTYCSGLRMRETHVLL